MGIHIYSLLLINRCDCVDFAASFPWSWLGCSRVRERYIYSWITFCFHSFRLSIDSKRYFTLEFLFLSPTLLPMSNQKTASAARSPWRRLWKLIFHSKNPTKRNWVERQMGESSRSTTVVVWNGYVLPANSGRLRKIKRIFSFFEAFLGLTGKNRNGRAQNQLENEADRSAK